MSSEVHEMSVEAYSDPMLDGAISALERLRTRGEKGDRRLEVLKAEKQRRASKRREDGKVASNG